MSGPSPIDGRQWPILRRRDRRSRESKITGDPRHYRPPIEWDTSAVRLFVGTRIPSPLPPISSAAPWPCLASAHQVTFGPAQERCKYCTHQRTMVGCSTPRSFLRPICRSCNVQCSARHRQKVMFLHRVPAATHVRRARDVASRHTCK